MPARPWVLAESNLAWVKEHPPEVAVLPLGATEPHNLHLPYGTDTFQIDTLGERICRDAWQQGAKALLLPTLPYGTETNLRAFPLALNVMPSTLLLVLRDLLQSLATSGVNKVLLLNGHGGNDLKPMLRELYDAALPRLFLCDWYKIPLTGPDAPRIEHPDDHAGEVETSFVLAFFPELVAKTAAGKLTADAGSKRSTRFDAVNQGWVSISRPWHLLTTNSGAGNPHAASAEKGRQLVDYLAARLVPFLVELAHAPVDSAFPY